MRHDATPSAPCTVTPAIINQVARFAVILDGKRVIARSFHSNRNPSANRIWAVSAGPHKANAPASTPRKAVYIAHRRNSGMSNVWSTNTTMR